MSDREDSLVDFVSSVAGDAYLKVEEHLGEGFVRLRTSEAERRQAKHDIQAVEDVVVELLRNARDAGARRIFLASSREGDEREIVCIDDGCGIPQGMWSRVFEPRVTSKLDTMVVDRYGVHGRGMALFSIRSNVQDASVIASDLGSGTAVRIAADTSSLSERRDQSTWPTWVAGSEQDDEAESLRGPRNILRMACEFSLDRPEVQLWAGSPAEIAATMYALAHQELGSQVVRVTDESRVPLWQRLAVAGDPSDLARRAAEVGLALSERHAHRVMAGEVRPLREVRRQLQRGLQEPPEEAVAASGGAPSVDLGVDRRSLKPTAADVIALQAKLAAAFDDFARRYYLELKDLPKVHVGKNEITVRFVVDKE